MSEKINVNGKRLNKLEETVKLLQKLNENYLEKTELDEGGYTLRILLNADGSGVIEDLSKGWVFAFDTTVELDEFLKANRYTQLILAQAAVYKSALKKKGN